MKKLLLFTLFLVFTTSIFAQKLSALIDYKSYYSPAGAPYLEISSFINGKTVTYLQNQDGKYQAEVRITVEAFQEDSVVNVMDFILMSEAFEDADRTTKPNFGEIKNFQLHNGEYILQFSLQDMFSDAKPISYVDVVAIDYPKQEVSISDISLYKEISKELTGDIFDKYGFSLKPLFYGYVHDEIYSLLYSCEIYNTNELVGDEQIIIKSHITGFENKLMPYPEAFYTTRAKAKPVVVTFGEIGIYKLPSGNYNLVVEVYNKDGVLLATNSYFFQRSNPKIAFNINDYNAINIQNTFVDQIRDTAQLLQYVRFLFPISSPIEKEFYMTNLSRVSEESLRRFFYAFWLKRDANNPEKAWAEYLAQVKHVNREFGCKLKQGYRTDRGRVFLQYGPPNSIWESPYSAHAYPYEIWHYYYLENQTSVKFIFWNTDLVSNDYELLHSDKRGEFQDPFWKIKVTQRRTPNFNFEVTEPENYYGGNAKDDWFDHR